MSELEKRKKLLVAESEVYREMLKLELHNFRIYGIHAKRKANSIRTYASLMTMLFPMMSGLGGRKGLLSRIKRLATLAYLGWQAYSRFGGLFTGAAMRRRARPRRDSDQAEEEMSARSMFE